MNAFRVALAALALGASLTPATVALAATTTERVSVSSREGQANGHSLDVGDHGFTTVPGALALSADGRYVAFSTRATNLDSADRDGAPDLYIRDRRRGTTTLVARDATTPSLSAQGRYVAFVSAAAADAADADRSPDVFVLDRRRGRVARVSGPRVSGRVRTSAHPAVSANGRYVAFASAARLVARDRDNHVDVYRADVRRGTLLRVSVARDGTRADDDSDRPSISAGGRYVAFSSDASNLVAGDTNRIEDVFVRDLHRGTTTRVSVGSGGAQVGAGDGEFGDVGSRFPQLSANGRFVAFASFASALVPGDTNGEQDVFVHDRRNLTTTRVSTGPGGAEAAGGSVATGISREGRIVLFTSPAPNLVGGDTNGDWDAFAHDRGTGVTIRVDVAKDGGQASATGLPALSADGRWAAFASLAQHVVPRDTNRRSDIFVRGPLRGAGATGAARRPAATTAAATVRAYDFDGDGRQDLATGVPGSSEGGASETGAVLVLRGTRRGASLSERLISQSTPGVPGVPQGDDRFGSAVASGDFDGDRSADLAVSSPGDGATIVLYGSRGGLTGARSVSLPATGTLAAGDLDGDGRADLAIGVTGDDRQQEDPGLPPDDYYGSGSLRVVTGGPAGLDPATIRTVRRPRRSDAGFGRVLAIGDVNGDGRADIVEGAQGTPHWVDDPPVPGHVSWCPGAPGGPVSCVSVGRPAPGPTALAVGDVTGDGVADLVAGVPVTRYVPEDGREPAGVVRVWRGRAGGPATVEPIRIRQSTPGVPGDDQGGDRFGAALAVAEVDADRYADIVVGAPGEDEGRGRVTVIRGARSGHAARGNRAFRPARRPAGAFGTAVALLDLTGDRRPELVIGEPGAPGTPGAVYVVRGRRGGPVAGRAQRITLATLGRRPPRDTPDGLAPPFGSILGG